MSDERQERVSGERMWAQPARDPDPAPDPKRVEGERWKIHVCSRCGKLLHLAAGEGGWCHCALSEFEGGKRAYRVVEVVPAPALSAALRRAEEAERQVEDLAIEAGECDRLRVRIADLEGAIREAVDAPAAQGWPFDGLRTALNTSREEQEE